MIGGLAELERSRGRGVQFGQKSKLTVQKQHHARQLLTSQTVQEVAALFNVHRATVIMKWTRPCADRLQ